MSAEQIAGKLHIPNQRCSYWLQVLESTGLIEAGECAYAVSEVGRSAVLDACSQDAWAYLAEEWRDRFPAVLNLARQIRESVSAWEAQGLEAPDYVAQIMESPERAERFTRMLCEIHQSLAEELANTLDLEGVEQLLDLGGGSGVISTALLQRNPDLTVTILDIPNVCAVGRKIARENGMEGRIHHIEADLLHDDLPGGFDFILQCDVGLYEEAYLRKILTALRPGGRLAIVDQFQSAEGIVPRQWMYWTFLASMENPNYDFGTTAELIASLEDVGFEVLNEVTLPGRKLLTWDCDWVLIETKVA